MGDESRPLEVKGLVAGYGDLEILHGVDLEVRPRELVCVIGPNGAGKSTVLKAIFGLAAVQAGHVRLYGEDVTRLRTERLVRAGVGYVPQLQNVFPNLTVEENLKVGAHTRPELEPERREHVFGLFPMLRERAGERVHRLSGGQRQMVAMGRALMVPARILLLDEPTAGLAPNLQEEVLERTRAIADSGTPVLLVEQNAKRALARCDRAYVLEQGRNRYEGPGPDLLADERLGRLYLGG